MDGKKWNWWKAIILIVVIACIARLSLVPLKDVSSPADRVEAAKYCEEVNGKTPVKTFSSDLCTFWTDGRLGECCKVHDVKYWCGGTSEERQHADAELRTCVNAIDPGIGTMMYPAVRIGGMQFLPTHWRWGYGWSWPYYGQ